MRELNGKRWVIEKWKTKTKLWSNGAIKEENVILEKKAGKEYCKWTWLTKERSKIIQNNGFSKELRLISMQTSRKIQNYGSRKERRVTAETEIKIL